MSTNPKKADRTPMLRYALGSTLLMALAMGVGWDMSYLTPVLALSFFAPGTTMPRFKDGLAFLGIIAATTAKLMPDDTT